MDVMFFQFLNESGHDKAPMRIEFDRPLSDVEEEDLSDFDFMNRRG